MIAGPFPRDHADTDPSTVHSSACTLQLRNLQRMLKLRQPPRSGLVQRYLDVLVDGGESSRSAWTVESTFLGYKPDMEFRPSWWALHCKAMGYPEDAKPVIIRVILKKSGLKEVMDLPRSYEGYPIVYEYRPPNRALGAPGLGRRLRDLLERATGEGTKTAPSIGQANPDTAGTLGGLLHGTHPGRHYLVTCAHVVGPPGSIVYQPGPFEGRQSQSIGIVRHTKIPEFGSMSDPCSEVATPDAHRLDLAVAELTVDVERLEEMGVVSTVNTIRPIQAMRQNDPVTFTGKTRGRIEAKIGALTLWDQIEFYDELSPGQKRVRCFGRLFEIRAPTYEYVRRELADPGDSGSWVQLQVGELAAWCGMVVSCDGGRAYACFSEYILQECAAPRAFGEELRLVA